MEIDITMFNKIIIIYFQFLKLLYIFKGKILSQPIFIAKVNLFPITWETKNLSPNWSPLQGTQTRALLTTFFLMPNEMATCVIMYDLFHHVRGLYILRLGGVRGEGHWKWVCLLYAYVLKCSTNDTCINMFKISSYCI